MRTTLLRTTQVLQAAPSSRGTMDTATVLGREKARVQQLYLPKFGNYKTKKNQLKVGNCIQIKHFQPGLKKMSIVLKREIFYFIPSRWCHAEQKI